jgi:hypothetical protein
VPDVASRSMRGMIALAINAALALSAPAVAQALPDGRAYEMVSPTDKNGGGVMPDSQRTRAAADGSAIGFASLTPFPGSFSAAIASDYVSARSSDPHPGTNGWTTSAIFPPLQALPSRALFARVDPLYQGEFSDDLSSGIVSLWGSLNGDDSVRDVTNLYLRTDLRSPGPGSYRIVSACPLCNATRAPLSPLPNTPQAYVLRPVLAEASPDFRHVVFESRQRLTSDAPPQPAGAIPLLCDMTFPMAKCRARLYEWDDGTVRFAGRVPVLPTVTCDDVNGPACVAADVSIAGRGAGGSHTGIPRTPHVVSDGSDGHTRIFVTQPTDAAGLTSDQVRTTPPPLQNNLNASFSGRLFMRVDGQSTIQLNVSERSVADTPAPGQFLDASVDGRRAFFKTPEALTNDAPTDGQQKMYMYDTSKPASSPDNLTFINRDEEPADTGGAEGMIGLSEDGHTAYFLTSGQLVRGGPILNVDYGIARWHDGTLSYIGRLSNTTEIAGDTTTNSDGVAQLLQARVTPDGRHLLFSAIDGGGLTGNDHGNCDSGSGIGCQQLYIYDANRGALACASCPPDGDTPTTMAFVAFRTNVGASQATWHWNHALSDDGSRVFFSTGDPLVPEDTNGRYDAYEYDVRTRSAQLLSSGTSTFDSWFMDASRDGQDAFILTREQLVGWDDDGAYDLYDARVGGGFPEPPKTTPCTGDACQGVPGVPPAAEAEGSLLFRGDGDLSEMLRPHAHRRRAKRCSKSRSGARRVSGTRRCVRRKRRAAQRSRHARTIEEGS